MARLCRPPITVTATGVAAGAPKDQVRQAVGPAIRPPSRTFNLFPIPIRPRPLALPDIPPGGGGGQGRDRDSARRGVCVGWRRGGHVEGRAPGRVQRITDGR